MENNELEKGIGDKESVSALKPAIVKVSNISIVMQKDKLGKDIGRKVSVTCIHPDKKDSVIEISSVKYESKGKLQCTGLWFKEDADGKIQKGSALSIWMQYNNVKTLKEMIGKELGTLLDDKGYLTFKAY